MRLELGGRWGGWTSPPPLTPHFATACLSACRNSGLTGQGQISCHDSLCYCLPPWPQVLLDKATFLATKERLGELGRVTENGVQLRSSTLPQTLLACCRCDHAVAHGCYSFLHAYAHGCYSLFCAEAHRCYSSLHAYAHGCYSSLHAYIIIYAHGRRSVGHHEYRHHKDQHESP